MGQHLQVDLACLEGLLSAQADRVEAMVLESYRGLHERNIEAAEKVVAGEAAINACEVEIEEQCLSVLALQQPVAIDLRRVVTILKVNGELERIADLAVNVAERTKSLASDPEVNLPRVCLPEPLEHMLRVVLEMLRDAHAALEQVNAELAREVIQRDDEVDAINRQVIAELAGRMADEPQNVASYLHVFSTCRIIERIGDHATNFAEDVVYLADGEITRHGYNARSA